MFLVDIFSIPAHEINADPNERNDQRPEIGHGFPVMSDVLEEQYQSDTANDAAGDRKRRAVLSRGEHCDKEQSAESDHNKGPQETPVKVTEDVAYEREQAKADYKEAIAMATKVGAIEKPPSLIADDSWMMARL